MIINPLKYLLLIVLTSILVNCGSGTTDDPELKRAIKASASLLLPKNLSRSAFYAAYPNGTPSDYVSYYFSSMGSAEWPPYEGGGEFSAEEMKMAGMSAIPQNVKVYPRNINPTHIGKQIIIKADNTRGVIIFEGYLLPSDTQAALVVEKKLPKVKASEFATMTFRSNQQMGIGY